MTFQKAVKTEAKLRLAIAGPSGSGKTYTALSIGTSLAGGGRVAVLDTEHGSASKYADLFDFDVLNEAAPFHPDKVTAAIQDAAKSGYSVLILDSMSHFWNGPGGMTDIVEDISRRMRTPNSFAAWKDGTPIQQRMIEAIVAAPLHIIATMRSKQDYILETGSDGKQRPRKVGMAPIQRDGFEYEFDVFMDMDNDNTGLIAKTRCPALTNGVFKKPGADVAAILTDWLKGVKAPERPVVAQPQPEPPKATPPAPPAPVKATNGTPPQANGHLLYGNGAVVRPQKVDDYQAYIDAHPDGKLPYNQKHLDDWLATLTDDEPAAPVAEGVDAPLFPLNNGAYMEN